MKTIYLIAEHSGQVVAAFQDKERAMREMHALSVAFINLHGQFYANHYFVQEIALQ